MRKLKHYFVLAAFVVLSAMSFNSYAIYRTYQPDTIWIPAHCVNGCYQEGFYVKFLGKVDRCRDLSWVKGHCDSCGNYVPSHYKVERPMVLVGCS
jgi:hypothetical protein